MIPSILIDAHNEMNFEVAPRPTLSLTAIATATHSVPALEKALAILELLACSSAGLTLAAIVKRTGLPKSSVHCIIVTLQRLGYLHRNDNTGRYRFGLKLFSLANSTLSGLRLRDQSFPHLYTLMQQTKLTVHMAILESYEAVLIAKVDCPGIIRMATWVGKRMEVHCTGLGKALVAHLPDEKLDQIVKERGLPRHNDNTLASFKKLKEDLAQTVKRGYSVDDEEDEIGLRCIGAPIFDHSRKAIAAVSVAGTTAQVTAQNVNELAGQVKDTANAITHLLEFQTA